ncbi:hypothetical protein QL285_053544 [Trifolium repens]|nr:hypothetical protein QL285_053544 [Trifolium repens]
MARRPLSKIKDIDDSTSLWRVAVLIKDSWTVTHGKSVKKHLELVVCDDLGDQIQVIVPSDLSEKFKDQLNLKTTLTMTNFDVEKNDLSFKPCGHGFKLVFNGATLLEDFDAHEITDPGLKLTSFADIKAGITRPDVFVDVIGAFHEIGYTQLVPGGRKLQVNLKLKDHAGDILNCTLWEDFASQFANYNNDRTEWGPTIILLHNAKINQPTDLYELGVSNAWNGTKLFINADLPEIIDFKQGLSVEEASASQSQQLSYQSPCLTQSSTRSQYGTADKFMKEALVLPLHLILGLDEGTTCVTVVKIKNIKPTRFGWYYKLCSQCPRAAKGDTLPIKCDKDHKTFAINLRYRLDIEVEYGPAQTIFVFWDRECNELLGKTAAVQHAEMLQEGVTNPLEYPYCFDKLRGRTLACRIKTQRGAWDNCSVQGVKEDDTLIAKIKELFPKDEVTTDLVDFGTPTSKGKEVAADSQTMLDVVTEKHLDDITFPRLEMSACAENEPEQLLLTPAKRCPPEAADRPKYSTEKIIDKESSSKITTRAKERQQIKREKN